VRRGGAGATTKYSRFDSSMSQFKKFLSTAGLKRVFSNLSQLKGEDPIHPLFEGFERTMSLTERDSIKCRQTLRPASGNPQQKDQAGRHTDVKLGSRSSVGTSTTLEAVGEFSQRSRDFDDALHVV
jgi:hypothetical protein